MRRGACRPAHSGAAPLVQRCGASYLSSPAATSAANPTAPISTTPRAPPARPRCAPRAATAYQEPTIRELDTDAGLGERAWTEDALRFLATTSAVLASSLDHDLTLERVTRLAVPFLADWCEIHVLGEADPVGGAPRVRQLSMAHVDPAKERAARELRRRYPINPRAGAGVAHVLRTGRPELYPVLADGEGARAAPDAEHLRTLRDLQVRSYMCVPLVVRGWALGVLSFAITESDRRYGPDDLALAAEMAGRAALAVDNARLYDAEQRARWAAERAAERMTRLHAITAVLSETRTPEEVADVVVRQGVAALGACAGLIAVLAEDGSDFTILRAMGYTPEQLEEFARAPAAAPIPVGDVVRTGQPVFLESAQALRALVPRPRGQRTTPAGGAWAALPLQVDARMLGAMGLSFAGPRPFTDEDRAYMLALARQCAQALDRARLRAAEGSARAEAQMASSAKSEFLAVMSHELRTPLNAITGYTSLLADGIVGQMTEAQRTHLDRIHSSAQHLLALIEEVLSLSRIEAGYETVRVEAVDVNALVCDAAAQVEPAARAKGIGCRVEAAPQPLRIATDPTKVRQILINLLANAVKFTDQGEVVVAAAADGARVVFTVRDTGRGIAPDQLAHIFDPFWRAEHRPDAYVPGTGLGLSVAQRLARLLGGDVAVESEVGKGSVFTVWLSVLQGSGLGGRGIEVSQTQSQSPSQAQ